MGQIARRSANPAFRAELLGELRLFRSGQEVELPASRKTRALLGFLLSRDLRRSRSELCDLLWDEAEDPRAALRWSLTKLRHALGPDFLTTDRNSVGLQHSLCEIDSLVVERAATRLADISSDELTTLENHFRGEFLNGLEMPRCYGFYEWCQAERAQLGQLREAVLKTLCRRFRNTPERALIYAHKLAAINPLDEAHHVQIVELLVTLGRHAEALTQANQCRTILSNELGIEPSDLLVVALQSGGTLSSAPRASDCSVSRPSRSSDERSSRSAEFLGRASEMRQIEAALSNGSGDIVLIVGVPGIGKTALLKQVRRSFSGAVLTAHAMESEQSRPFGVWIDALRACDAQRLSEPVASGLRSLVSMGPEREQFDHEEQVFEVVAGALLDLSSTEPLLVLIDDLQWIDAASVALLSYAIRRCATREVHFCLTARPGELEDNDRASAILTRISGRTRRFALSGLADDAAARLARSLNPECDTSAILSKAKGNPLYLIALAGTETKVRNQDTSESLQDILALRIDCLPPSSISLLSWAAVFGPQVPSEMLIEASGVGLHDAMDALDRLSQHELLIMDDAGTCAFSHDLVRDAAYTRLSNVRRRLMHGKIARLLSLDMTATLDRPLDVLRHSIQSGQHLLGATAAVHAGENALRIYANTEAAHLARQGLALANRLTSRNERASVVVRLLGLQVFAASGALRTSSSGLVSVIRQEIEVASQLAMAQEVAHGYYVLSVLHQEAGDYAASQEATELASRSAEQFEVRSRVRQLANSARCLFEIGREIPKARILVTDAAQLAEGALLSDVEVIWSRALMAHWDGDLEAAATLIENAIRMVRVDMDRWRESKCLTWAAMIALEDNRVQDVITFATELGAIASRIGESSCAPRAAAFSALAQRDAPAFRAAIDRLRLADDKSHQATLLNLAADWQTRAGNSRSAQLLATNAFAIADAIGDRNEMACAAALISLNSAADAKADNCHTALIEGVDRDLLSARTLKLVAAATAQSEIH